MSDQTPSRTTLWTWAAFLAALATLAGSLFLSVGMGLEACPLCFYQRTFVMAVVGVLAIGLLTGAGKVGHPTLGMLALPAAAGGVGVAVFHVYLEAVGKLECPLGIQGVGTAPQQALVAQAVVLAFLLLVAVAPGSRRARGIMPLGCGLILGLLFAWAAIKSAPPPKDPPKTPYDAPPKICRPAYQAQ